MFPTREGRPASWGPGGRRCRAAAAGPLAPLLRASAFGNSVLCGDAPKSGFMSFWGGRGRWA